YNIALHHNLSSPDSLVAEILALGVKCVPFKCDLNNFNEVASLIPAVCGEFSELEVLINNASIFESSTISKTTEALFDAHFNINFKAPFFLSKAFAAEVGKGSIINILDTKIRGNNSPHAAYLLAKKALAEFTVMAAKEFAPGIRVNGISPGLILPQNGKDQGYFDKLAEKIPLKKRGYPQDVARAVGFFIESEFITGEILSIDGGEMIR
ncbi:MAG: SDR family oxidoreductase, partial [Proteobacteria bacterium]|nr:SDR family oxidoreductase [Pseudomonadota bacterium]